jgi:Ca2+-binding EF-hand superfamily protein
MKSFKAMMSEVAQPEPAEEKAFKAQHTVVSDKHPVALETQHKGTKTKAKRKADQEGDANYDLAYESVDLEEMKVKNSDAAFKLETEISNLEKRIAKLKPLALKDDDANMKLAMARKSLKQKQDAHSALMKEAVDLDEGEDKEPASPDEASMAMKQADFLAYVGREMKDHLKAGKEFPEWMQNKLSKLQQAAQDLHSNFGAHGEDDMDEALSPKQKKIDHNKNGKIDGEDLAMIRAKKNEETNLAELSKSTLGSYAKKAKTDIAHRSYDQGSDDEMGADRSKRNDRLLKNRSKGVDKAVDRLTKEGFASDAQRKAIWASKNEKGVKEELKGDQHKIDKNKNGKIDAHDFKLLKKESLDELKQSIFNAYVIEAEKKIVSPFDLKNYRSQIPTKAGEKAGFDSKKVSTGTVYSRKPVKEAAYEKGMDDKKKVVVKGVKGMKSTPFTKTFRNMAAYDKWSDSDAAGDYEVHQVMNEEVELDEAMLASHSGGSSMIVHHDLADHKERHKKVLSLHKNLTKLGYSTKSKEHLNIAHHEKTKDTVHGSKYDNKDVTYTHPSKPHKTMQYWTDHADRQGKRNHVVQVFNQRAKKANLPESMGLAKGSDDKEPFDYEKWKASTVKPRKPRGWRDAEALGKALDREQSELRKRKMKEEVELDEAFKVGIVKLKDNTSMVLKKEDADILNKLMSSMSAGSVKKMTETAMKDKNGFAEILAFAKEAV